MVKLISTLFILLVFNINIFAQSSKSYSIVYIVNKIIDKGEYLDDIKINKKNEINTKKLIYIYNFKKDTIAYYDFYESAITAKKKSALYTLTRKEDTLSLNFKGNNYENKIKLVFNIPTKTIRIGSKDVFYLNDIYYKYLYKNIYENLNILDLIDFLEDFLQDYNLEDLKFISSNEKYKHKDFKLIKAYMESYRSQASDYLDKWNVKFLYNKEGILNYLLKESTEGDQSLEKKIVFSKKDTFKYLINRNNESRLITTNEKSFNINTNSYDEKVTALQVGLGKETKYEIKRTVYKVFPSDELFLNSKNILEIISLK
ncbi:hypothetical protein FNW52_20120 [Flavobacterium sp. ZT3R18]|uniref:hypothetical protein n=1 Tax=Flavobacterium sp. ZT3R18 TaxID=2594429 RepID=UPI00117BDCE3|nr:hypothetical protein [Flavobacterium sp. ZT3R18]TRX30451.1 hypothetical protein FNW52_20120 [Flavobacterium sp. ZT3R18]